MYNQTHLLTFLTVLRTGSFAGAAGELGYTASAVSQQIASLESSTGLALFDRGARNIRPTSAALVLAERSRDLMADFAALQESIDDLVTGRSGRIRVGAVPSAAARLLPNALSRFVATQPGAELLMDEGPTAELTPMLQRGEYDMIVTSEHGPPASRLGRDYVARKLIEDRMLLLVNRNRKDRKTAADGIEAFADELWAAPRTTLAGWSYFEQLCGRVGFSPKVRYRSANFAVLNEMVRVGVAVALVPVLGYEPHPEITASPVEDELATRTLSAIFRRSNRNPLLVPLLRALENAGADAETRIRTTLAELDVEQG